MRNAVFILLRAQFRSRLRRVRGAFSTPRRCLLSLVVILLSIVWTGQTVTSMLLRDPYPVEQFRTWTAVGLFAWTLWHLFRVAWKRPESPVEWSPAERDFILSSPFSFAETLAYRFVVILSATLPKVLLTLLVLWPDLSWSSPIGLLFGLVSLELWRMLTDAGTCCLSTRGYGVYRSLVVAGLCILVGTCWVSVNAASGAVATTQHASQVLETVLTSSIGSAIMTPFFWCADVVSGQQSVGVLLLLATGMAAWVVVLVLGIAWLEQTWQRTRLHQERVLCQTGCPSSHVQSAVATAEQPLPTVPVFGPLAWRQWRRASQYAGSLVISMAIPAMLMLPFVFAVKDAMLAFGIVFGGSLFYSFVLLPEALKFDFRLDMDHLVQLKMLPLSAARVVVGQLMTPVLLAFAFQASVLVSVSLYRGIDSTVLMTALCYCLPLNVLFVALDNLVFLLYPHRPTEEGFEAFLRTILKFTGKTVLITLALGTLLLWAPVAASLAGAIGVATSLVFVWGTIAGIVVMAMASVACVADAFRRFDVSLHSV